MAASEGALREGVLTLENALEGQKNLEIHYLLQNGLLTDAFGLGFNARPHQVSFERVKATGQKLSGELKVTSSPYRYRPS